MSASVIETTKHRVETPQESFWSGAFGAEYTQRNAIDFELRVPFFAEILQKTFGVRSICEMGANKGHNLGAIQALSPMYELTGVEINPVAFDLLKAIPRVTAINSAIQDFNPAAQFDLVFTCGVLIHLNPDDLPKVYEKMMSLSSRYILINEYFNPVPVEISYRGHSEKLFKRDFAGELMDQYPNQLRVVATGFLWKRVEPTWDDATWFLLEKTSP